MEEEIMNVYVFSSANLTNIWAGVGAHMWAISLGQSKNPSIQGKAKNLPIGGFGIFYCVEKKALTTPFIVRSKPDEKAIIVHIWPGEWALPFRIVPLGSPEKLLFIEKLVAKLPSLSPEKHWDSLFHVSPITVFAPSRITDEDWAVIINELAQE